MPTARRASASPGPGGTQLRALVDADNVRPQRLVPVLRLLAELAVPTQLTAGGARSALARVAWPPDTELLERSGWQSADLALAAAYSPDERPLLLVTGDGDFGLLAGRHPGPVLVVSGAASGRLRDGTTVVDPALDGLDPIRAWLAHHGLAGSGPDLQGDLRP